MKKILYVLLFLILSFIGWLAYMGVFNTVEVIDGREGGYELAGIFHHGSYGNIGATFEEMVEIADENGFTYTTWLASTSITPTMSLKTAY